MRAVAYGPYEDRMKAAIHALKYDRLHPAARGLGRMLAEAIAKLAPEALPEMLVVPVPLHRSKYVQRGFNQARSLAFYALRSLRESHPEWRLTLASSTLMRLRATESQFGLTPRQRRINVRGAFTVSDPFAVASRHILVIDDIFTTGATARAAAKALMDAGAASVWVATLARAGLVNMNSVPEALDNSDNSDASFEEEDDNFDPSGGEPDARPQPASIHSLHEQPSF